jgi:hypothetical protein
MNFKSFRRKNKREFTFGEAFLYYFGEGEELADMTNARAKETVEINHHYKTMIEDDERGTSR